jgi:hypothetical protein
MAAEIEAPPADIVAAIERLRAEMRYMRDEIADLKKADKERSSNARALVVGCIFAFLGPSFGIVWGYSQLTARVDALVQSGAAASSRFGDHESRLRYLEKIRHD